MSNKPVKKGDLDKGWHKRTQVSNSYSVDSKEVQKRFLIFCEGATEKDYFDSFPVASASVKAIAKGEARTTLVESAIKEKVKYPDHEHWVVFDLDFSTLNNNSNFDYHVDFDEAIALAKKEKINVAYSNDNFELWFLLHFEPCGTFLRQYYYDRLSEIWKKDLKSVSYDNDKGGKKASFRKDNYQRLLANQEKAIEQAKKLHTQHTELGTFPYSKRNPCTTVYKLVQELNRYLKK